MSCSPHLAAMQDPIRSTYEGEPLSNEEAARVMSHAPRWYHAWEIRPGLTSPGTAPIHPPTACDMFAVPENLAGMTALDVGAYDGALTFELERRGARAIALDVRPPDRTAFGAARMIAGSRAIHYTGSVYQLPFAEMNELDLILLRGVYYHLKHPILGLECLARSLRVGGTLHFEGAALADYVENVLGDKVPISLADAHRLDVPLCAVYPRTYRGANNWFIPNRACLQGWLETAGLEVEMIELWKKGDDRRLYGYARKTHAFVEAPEIPAL